jgi:peptidoglycan hydrolase-like protein with peptidoglycan-binding domain
MWPIRRGMVGTQVRDLQIALNAFTGADLRVDGVFGPKTEEAVRTFQMIFNLTIDGIVGKQTGACLVAASFCAKPGYQFHAMARLKAGPKFGSTRQRNWK